MHDHLPIKSRGKVSAIQHEVTFVLLLLLVAVYARVKWDREV